MAVNNNVNQNSQEQIIQEQIRQQQVQQNQTVNNPTNNVEPVGANTEVSNPQPAVPSNETAKVQELKAQGEAKRATLNERANSLQPQNAMPADSGPTLLSSNMPTVYDKKQELTDSILAYLKPIRSATTRDVGGGFKTYDLPLDQQVQARAENTKKVTGEELAYIYLRDQDRFSGKPLVSNTFQSDTTDPRFIYREDLRYSPAIVSHFGVGENNWGSLGEVFEMRKNEPKFAENFFKGLGVKGTANLLSDSFYDSNPLTNPGFPSVFTAIKELGNKFSDNDMLNIAKEVVNVRLGRFGLEFADELRTDRGIDYDTAFKNSESNAEKYWGMSGASMLAKINTNFKEFASVEVNQQWKNALNTAVSEVLDPERGPNTIGGIPVPEGASYSERLDILLNNHDLPWSSPSESVTIIKGIAESLAPDENKLLEIALKNKTDEEKAAFLEKAVSSNDSNEKFNARGLVKIFSVAGNSSADFPSSYPSTLKGLNYLANTNDKRYSDFTKNILKSTASFASSPDEGVGLGRTFSNVANGSGTFAENAINYAHQIRADKNATPLQKASTPALVDVALGALIKNPPTEFHKNLNTDDYKDLAKLGRSLPDFIDRIKSYTGYDNTKIDFIKNLSPETSLSKENFVKLTELFNGISGEKILATTGFGTAGDNNAKGLVPFFKRAVNEDLTSEIFNVNEITVDGKLKFVADKDTGIYKAIDEALKQYKSSPVNAAVSLGKFMKALKVGLDEFKNDADKVKEFAAFLGDTVGGTLPAGIDLGPAGSKVFTDEAEKEFSGRINSGEDVIDKANAVIRIASERKSEQLKLAGASEEEYRSPITIFHNTYVSTYNSFKP
jgi:hypothetical protein